EQLRQEPQQEGAVEPRALHQLVGRQNVDISRARSSASGHVPELAPWLAEEALAALLLQRKQRSLDGADRLLAHIAVLGGERGGILGDVLEHRLQVLEVEQQQL